MSHRPGSPRIGMVETRLAAPVNWSAVAGLVIMVAIGASFWTGVGWLIGRFLR